MLRELDLQEISDGKKYSSNDMVKVGCEECRGCSACCRGMGNSILIDPLDAFLLTKNLGVSMEQLLAETLELNVVDGIVLPNMKMQENTGACGFLNGDGRCSIHGFRPGFCRLFPLARIYEGEDFYYIYQVRECVKDGKTKEKVKKWLGVANIKAYEQFTKDWHSYVKRLQKQAAACTDQGKMRDISLSLLHGFYLTPYDYEEDFYKQFYGRMQKNL